MGLGDRDLTRISVILDISEPQIPTCKLGILSEELVVRIE